MKALKVNCSREADEANWHYESRLWQIGEGLLFANVMRKLNLL